MAAVDGIPHTVDADVPVALGAVLGQGRVGVDRLVVEGRPAVEMQLHLRLELRLDLVQLGHHHLGRQGVVDVGQALDKLLLHLGVFQEL